MSPIFIFVTFCLIIDESTTRELPSSVKRAQRASHMALDNINRLLNVQVQRELLQSDSWRLSEPLADNAASSLAVRTAADTQPRVEHHDELKVNNPDDYFHGDIDLTAWQALRIRRQIQEDAEAKTDAIINDKSPVETEKRARHRAKRKIGREPVYKRWDKRRLINYDFADSIPERTRQVVRAALAAWQRTTCLRFREGGPDLDRLEFYDGGGCSSFVGRTGGTQGISISTPGCDHIGIVAHEIGHALGIFHEQARPDQRSHIAVNYQNIPISRWNNFHPIANSHASTYNLPYDAGSVMHYGPFGFATDPYRPTISTLDHNLQSTIGQRVEPSFLDVQSINEAYECYAHCLPSAIDCAHGGYPNPSDCSRCVCPRGFGGRHCRQVEDSTCGGVVEVPAYSIYLSSPNYPQYFLANQTCVWLLRAAGTGLKRQIVFEFIDNFQYTCEDSTTCDRSYVELKTGIDFRATGYRFCCSLLYSKRFISAGDEMVVIHVAGTGDSPTLGFRARVWAIGDVPVMPIASSTTESSTTMTTVRMTFNRVFPSSRLTTRGIILTTTESTTTNLTTSLTITTSEQQTTVQGITTKAVVTVDTFLPLPGEYTKSTKILSTSTSQPIATPIWPPSPITMAPPPASLTLPYLFRITSTPPTSTVEGVTTPPDSTSLPELVKCAEVCGPWSKWTDCSQKCGGCGRRQRTRTCAAAQAYDNCPMEEKRACAFDACPTGTNFLINNAEFHILWKGCCMGMFKRPATASQFHQSGDQCAPLQTGENGFLQIISSLLNAQDLKNGKQPRKTINPSAVVGRENGIKHSISSDADANNLTLARRLENLART